ncbi:MAG: very short patch repair endonuclease [Solirubrobacterales bacterium]
MLGLPVAPLPYPNPTSAKVSERMRRNRRRDSRAEIALRAELHRRGLRFRVDLPLRAADRIVRPDVVFSRPRLAVFVDGCFWHCCPAHGNIPRANVDYWRPKLARNVARDQAVNLALTGAGWRILRAWEHEEPDEIADRVVRAYAEGLSDPRTPL